MKFYKKKSEMILYEFQSHGLCALHSHTSPPVHLAQVKQVFEKHTSLIFYRWLQPIALKIWNPWAKVLIC